MFVGTFSIFPTRLESKKKTEDVSEKHVSHAFLF